MNLMFGLLFAAIPLTMLAEHLHWSPLIVMILACAGIVPVARLMGQATEHLSHHVGPTTGGLLSATFGNACELIIAIFALRAGLIEVVKASITGSILGNILLVMGASMLVGGSKHEQQEFNPMTAITAAAMLSIASFSLMMPAAIHHFTSTQEPGELHQNLAVVISVILVALYFMGLFFSLGTHRHLFVPVAGATDEDDGEMATWSMKKSVMTLGLATVAIAVLSEYLVSNVEAAASMLGMTPMFVGVILLALIGNAAENSTAVLMAHKNKMDLSINIALGSSTQIALFVTPVIVFAGLILGQPMDLLFSPAEIVSVLAATMVAWLVIQDGKSNWFEGAALLALYAILGATFYFIR